MANLLGWFKKEIGQAGNAIGGAVHGAEQNVGHFVQGAQQNVGQAAQNVNHTVQGAQNIVQRTIPQIPNFHLPQIQGITEGANQHNPGITVGQLPAWGLHQLGNVTGVNTIAQHAIADAQAHRNPIIGLGGTLGDIGKGVVQTAASLPLSAAATVANKPVLGYKPYGQQVKEQGLLPTAVQAAMSAAALAGAAKGGIETAKGAKNAVTPASTPIRSLKIGTDAQGPLNPARVNQIHQDILLNRPVEPVVTKKVNGQLYVQDGAHRLAAAQQAGLTHVPTIDQANYLANQRGGIKLPGGDTPKPSEQLSIVNKGLRDVNKQYSGLGPNVFSKEFANYSPQEKLAYAQKHIDQLRYGYDVNGSPSKILAKPEQATAYQNLVERHQGLLAQRKAINNAPIPTLPKPPRADQVAPEKVASFEQSLGLNRDQAALAKENIPAQQQRFESKVAMDENAAGFPNKEIPLSAQKTSPLVKAFGSKSTIVKQQGPYGQVLDKLVNKQIGDHQIMSADIINKTPTVWKLNKDQFSNFADAAHGRTRPMDIQVQQALKEWKAVSPTIQQRGVKAGLNIGNVEDYFPKEYDKSVFSDRSKYNQSLNHLIKSGQANSIEDAVRQMKDYQSGVRQGKYGHFKSRGIELPQQFETKTKDVLARYVSGASRAVTQAENFGAHGNKLDRLVGRIAESGHDAKTAQKAVERYLRTPYDDSTGAKVLKGVREAESASRLGKAGLSHLGQTLQNVAPETGLARTGRAWVKSLNPADRAFAKSTGAVSEEELRGLRSQEGYEGKLGKITAPGLNPVMKQNRIVASIAGRDWGNSLARRGKTATLERLGVSGPIGKKLTPAQEVQAARGVVRDTMFRHTPWDTPLWAETPGGKTVGQFRMAYAYKQPKFVYEQIVKEAGRGNIAPLLRFLTVGTATGYGTVLAKNAITGRKESTKDTVIDTLAGLGGLPTELLAQGRYLKNNPVGTVAGAVAPLAGEAVNLIDKGAKAASGSPKALEKDLLGRIPVVGSRVANTVFPASTSAGSSSSAGQPGGTANSDLAKAVAQSAADKKAGQPQNIDQYLSKDQQNFLKLSKDQQQAYLSAHPDQAYLAKSADEKKAAEQIINGVHPNLPGNLDAKSVKVLTNYDRLSQDGKNKFNQDPKNTYSLDLANYNKDVVSGKLSAEQQYTKGLTLAKQKIESNYSKEVAQLNGFSKAKLIDFFNNNPDKAGLFGQVQQLDQALAGAGLISTTKFKNGLASASKGAGSRGGKAPKYTIPKIKVAKISQPKGIKVKKIAYKPYKPKKVAISKMPKIG